MIFLCFQEEARFLPTALYATATAESTKVWLTGESNLIEKNVGDELLSGSFIAAGKCYAQAVEVGADCYAAKINNEAKYIKK